MAKVVGISGAQGGGKSSLLGELKNRGWTVDDFKVSRAVQAQLGWETLDRVMDSPYTMMEFQRAVWSQKTQREEYLRDQPGHIILTERTFADICAYSCNWGWQHLDKNSWPQAEAVQWSIDISRMCFTSQQRCYSGVVLLPFMEGVVQWQDDANRAKRSTIDTIYEEIERFTQYRNMIGIRAFTITAKSVAERANQVENFLETL